MLQQDWHIHTRRSKCAKPESEFPAIVQAATKSQLRLIGIADHIDGPEERDWFTGVIAGNRADLKACNPPFTVLIGTEASMLSPARCALDADFAAQLDFVMAACNHYHLKTVENPATRTPEAYADHYLDVVTGAIELGYVDTISHPFLHSKLGLEPEEAHEVLKQYNETRLAQVLAKAASASVAFEINPGHAAQAIEWFRDLVQEAQRHGTQFTLGSDAHHPQGIGYPPVNGKSAGEVCAAIGLQETDLKWPDATS